VLFNIKIAIAQTFMSSPPLPSSAPNPAFVRALRRVLRPLVQSMLAQGITYPYLANMLKSVFVEVADKEFRIGGQPSTDSRVSLVSGVHRKDVSTLRPLIDSSAEQVPPAVSLGSQLVALWLGSSKYVDENGAPKPLHRFASEGGDLSFEALVASVNSDIRSRVVLDEWQRLGVVHMDEQRRVCLNTDAFVPADGFDEKAFYFGHNLHDHAAAATSNLLGQGAPFLERSVHYDELSSESVAKLRKQAEQVGMRALLAVNQNAMKLETQDTAQSTTQGELKDSQTTSPYQRITFGIYFYTEAAPNIPATATSAAAAAANPAAQGDTQ
jgi:Family of unknown function (DUF6502)